MKFLPIRANYFRETRHLLLCLLSLCYVGLSHATAGNPPDSIDFTGKIKKFDATFDGIGPKVYFLPRPPSPEELMSQQYLAQQHEEITIPKMLSKTTVLTELKPTGDEGRDAIDYSGPRQSAEGWLLMEIEFAARKGDRARVSDMQNLLAHEYFRVGTTDRAIEFLQRAYGGKVELNAMEDMMSVNYNLATLYEYTDELTRARSLFETVRDHAKARRNRRQQADAMTRLALVKAKQGYYHEAEQDIIITVIPLYRQLRNTDGEIGKVIAYTTLSHIYRLQNRYPEAQWFLLQAREVAIEQNLSQFMPGIIFNLAEVKKLSGNTEVAVDEYIMADEMVNGRQDFLVMRLAIQDALGDIYHGEGKFREALEAANRFDLLKAQLISTDFPF